MSQFSVNLASNATDTTDLQLPAAFELTSDRQYVQYQKTYHTDFITWFQSTSWYLTRDRDTHSVPVFKKKLSKAWLDFIEIAYKETGQCLV